MDVLSSRFLLRPSNPERSRRFYRDTLGLAVHREFGTPEEGGMVFFLGAGFLEVSGRGPVAPSLGTSLWLQVRNLQREYDRLRTAGIAVLQAPRLEPWGLWEMTIEDPDGLHLILVEVPDDHPLRLDQRS